MSRVWSVYCSPLLELKMELFITSRCSFHLWPSVYPIICHMALQRLQRLKRPRTQRLFHLCSLHCGFSLVSDFPMRPTQEHSRQPRPRPERSLQSGIWSLPNKFSRQPNTAVVSTNGLL